MSWESIIGFIVIAVISSIFRGKNQNPHRRTSDPSRPTDLPRHMETPTQVPPKPMDSRTTNQRPISQRGMTPTSASPTNRPRPSGGLEEMIRELQKNMGEVFNQPTTREVEVDSRDLIEEEKIPVKEMKPKEVDYRQPKPLNPITDKEIGRESIGNVKFNRQTILQGIIMSEVLGKPKSLKK